MAGPLIASSDGPVAVAFPGQGVDPVRACAVVAEHAGHPLVAALAGLTGRSEWRPADLADTRAAQPVVVAAGLLAAEAAGLRPDEVSCVAGHSLGEVTALAFVGVMTPEAALDLVVRRASIGHRFNQERPGRMIATLKVELDVVEAARSAAVAEVGGELELAVVNGPLQMVLSGDRATADRAADLVAEAGGVPRRLGIGGAFHSPLLAEGVADLAAAAAAVCTGTPVVPVVMSTSTAVIDAGNVAAAPSLLGEALVRPVDWVRTMGALRDRGVALAVDAGPGRTLANLADHTPVVPFTALDD